LLANSYKKILLRGVTSH